MRLALIHRTGLRFKAICKTTDESQGLIERDEVGGFPIGHVYDLAAPRPTERFAPQPNDKRLREQRLEISHGGRLAQGSF